MAGTSIDSGQPPSAAGHGHAGRGSHRLQALPASPPPSPPLHPSYSTCIHLLNHLYPSVQTSISPESYTVMQPATACCWPCWPALTIGHHLLRGTLLRQGSSPAPVSSDDHCMANRYTRHSWGSCCQPVFTPHNPHNRPLNCPLNCPQLASPARTMPPSVKVVCRLRGWPDLASSTHSLLHHR